MIPIGPLRNQRHMNEMIIYALSDKWDASNWIRNNQPEQCESVKERQYAASITMSLFFDSMGNREAQIPERYARTFEWVFKEPRRSEEGQFLWHSFPKWLEEDSDQIYWVTGKPGAGKSTLIKFIAHDARLHRHLSQWTDGAQLLIGRYFPWNASVEALQKTHEGLLRTLLFEILKQNKSLVARVFPGRWFLLELFNGALDLPEPKADELMRAFRALLSETSKSLKLVLIIDGLDEFEGDHTRLTNLLREANLKPWVKICTSSRPWNVFKDEYINNPMLQLEKLTHDDIELYVRENFQRSLGFQAFEVTNPAMATTMIGDIVEKAQGVFLWVSIVSGLLKEFFQEGCNQADLESVIDGLPNEVFQLFTYLWDRTNVKFRKEASEYFQVMRAFKEPHSVPYCLTFWLGDTAVSADIKAEDITREYVSKAVESLARKLVSRTGGLLETSFLPGEPEKSRVDYMHRTAADWVSKQWDVIASSTDENFDPNLWVLKGEVIMLVGIRRYREIQSEEISWANVAQLVKRAEFVKDTAPSRLLLAKVLDRLDRKLSTVSASEFGCIFSLSLGYHRLHGQQSHDVPHWCNRGIFRQESTDWIDRFKLFDSTLSFLGYMARYPIAPYIKAKLEEDPNAFSADHSISRILENVVFGRLCGLPPSAFSFSKTHIAISLDVVELLLQRGICLDQVKNVRGFITEVKETKRQDAGFAEYWDANVDHYLTSMANLLDKYYVPGAEREERVWLDVWSKLSGILQQLKEQIQRYLGQSIS